jgi:hypothetical protein
MKAKSYPEVRICIESLHSTDEFITITINDEEMLIMYFNDHELHKLNTDKFFELINNNLDNLKNE